MSLFFYLKFIPTLYNIYLVLITSRLMADTSASEITVIQQVDEEKILSKEEREASFRELSAATKIPFVHFQNIAQLDDEQAELDVLAIKPEILGLLVRKILDFGCVQAIVKTFPKKSQNMEDLRKEYGLVTRKFGSVEGGKVIKKRPAKPSQKPVARMVAPEAKKTPEISGQFAVSVQLTHNQEMIYLQDLQKTGNPHTADLYQGSSLENIDICGFVIKSERPLKRYYINEVPGNMRPVERLKSGNYADAYMYYNTFEPYYVSETGQLKQNLSVLAPLGKTYDGDVVIIFQNETHTRQICTLLHSFLLYLWNGHGPLGDYIRNFVKLAQDKIGEQAVRQYSSLFTAIVKNMTLPEEQPVKDLPVETGKSLALVQNIKRALIDVEKYNTGKFSYQFQSSLWFDIASLGMVHYLEKLLYLINNPRLDKAQKAAYEADITIILDKLARSQRETAQRQIKINQIKEATYREMTYRWIYINKFTYAAFQKVEARMPKYGETQSSMISAPPPIFNYITKREREIVEIEYDRLEEYYKAVESNEAPWLDLANKFRTADTKEDQYKYYKQLTKYLPVRMHSKTGENDWLRSKEGFPIICPHVRDLMDMEIAGTSPEEIHTRIMKYAGDSQLFTAYYCRICGEAITYADDADNFVMFEGDQPVVLHNVEDQLKDFIWKQTNQVVRNYVEFKELKNNKFINQFISSLIKGLYDFVNLIDKKLRKSKTSSLEEVENKLKLFTQIYIYAALMKIMIENPGKLKFSELKHTAIQTNAKSKTQQFDLLYRHSLNKIIITQNVLLNKLPDITEEFLKSSLLKAYKNVESMMSKTKMEAPSSTDITTLLINDPTFQYIAKVSALASLDKKGHSGETSIDAFKKRLTEYEKPQNIFHKDPNKLKEDEHIYEKVQRPKVPSGVIEEFYGLTDPAKLIKKIRGKNQTRDEYLAQFYKGYFWESFEQYLGYILGRAYISQVFHVHITKDPENENLYNIKVDIDPNLKKYIESTNKLRRAETVLRDLNHYYQMPAYGRLPFHTDDKFNIAVSDQDLARNYGYAFNQHFDDKTLATPGAKMSGKNKFHRHSWKLYAMCHHKHYRGPDVSSYKPGELRVYTNKDMINPGGDEYWDWMYVDTICDICYHAWHNITEVVKDPRKILEQEQLVNSFYNFYENRCPKPNSQQIKINDLFHVWTNNKCSNCGLTKEELAQHSDSYFNKYLSVFQKDFKKAKHSTSLTTSDNADVSSLSIDNKPPNILDVKIPETIKKWKYNTNIINDFLSKTWEIVQKSPGALGKLKKGEYFNILANLGLTEKVEYDKVIDGTENPYKKIQDSPSLILGRVNHIHIYINELIFDYNIFQNYKNLPSSGGPDIKALVATLTGNMPKLDPINQLYKSSDLTYPEWYQGMQEIYLQKSGYLDLSNFLLEYFYTLLLGVLLHLTKKINIKTGEAFTLYFIQKIIRMERNISKLKEQKAAQVEATNKQNVEDDSNMQDHRQSRTFDDLPGEDKFGYEGMDYEGQNDTINDT